MCLMVGDSSAEVGGKNLAGWSASSFRAREKKLIGFVWGMPSPSYLRDHIRQLEETALYLDGIVFKLPETVPGEWPPWVPAFDNCAWTEKEVPLATLKQVRRGRLKRNFISLGPGPNYDETRVSWFDDAAWKVVAENLKLLSLAIKVSGARGVFFNFEKASPWTREGITPEATAAIQGAKAKVLGSQSLGWTMVWQSLDQPIPSKVFDTPDFRITSPKPNAVFSSGEPVAVEVMPGEDVTLTSIQLYLDSRPVLSLPGPPFRVVLRNVPPGAHTLEAVGHFSSDRDRGQTVPVVFEVKRRQRQGEARFVYFEDCGRITLTGCRFDSLTEEGKPSMFVQCQFNLAHDVTCTHHVFRNVLGACTEVNGASDSKKGRRGEFTHNALVNYCDTGIGLWTAATDCIIASNYFYGWPADGEGYGSPVGIDVAGGKQSVIEM